MNSRKPGRRLTGTICVVLGGLACVTVALLVWRKNAPDAAADLAAALSVDTETVVLDANAVARIEAFCGDCHAVPKPESFPRAAWHNEVMLGYAMYARSGRQDLKPPPFEETFAYYRQNAPQQLTFPDPPEASEKLAVSFHVERLTTQEIGGVKPAVAHLTSLRLKPDAEPELIVSDMRRGSITALAPGKQDSKPRVLATLNQPCHVESCDLDSDGAIDLVVADLGSMAAIDHLRGRVVWLRAQAGGESYEPVVVASGLGRVDDVRPGDFDNDGDVDLVVAVFGLDRTGDTRVLWNVAERGETPRFETEIVDPRPGPIHVPPCDFDGDGYLDFAALITQEYEQVAVFINQRGKQEASASFHMQSLWEGPDLTFGSSGIQLADIDGDGDMDVLYANGDSFDNNFVNPRYGVQWLENQGQLTFAYHRLTDLVGACVASAGDIDLDGDLDILATVWLPRKVQPANVYDRPLASVVCLEQTAPGEFVRHTLEKDCTVHAAMNMADYDGDGDLDFAVGYHSFDGAPAQTQWVDIWWNQKHTPTGGG